MRGVHAGGVPAVESRFAPHGERLVKKIPPTSVGERRYTEEELALILNRAAERELKKRHERGEKRAAEFAAATEHEEIAGPEPGP